MNAIILAGGEGIRLRQTVRDIPKPMAPIAGKPFLEFLIDHLISWDIKRIVLSTGYKGDFGCGKRWGIEIIYSHESTLLGTGGALKEAVTFMNDHQFLVINGDSFVDLDISRLLSFHLTRHATVTMSLVHVADTSRYGRVEVDGEGKVKAFHEKGVNSRGTINGGVYIMNRDIRHSIPPGKASLEKDVFPLLCDKELYGVEVKGYFIDIGSPKEYLELNEHPEKFITLVGNGSRIRTSGKT
jgi:NDP-sugar pyrophosphorylase family protein